ncbi:hypothetical protein HA402_010355 [Bradysia odoriphaga]|nr:hypothetical protein HA402_010355 [Bradysia odoriphaga]
MKTVYHSVIVLIVAIHSINSQTFNNPISDINWPDPYAYLHTDGFYYMPRSENNGLVLYRTQTLSNWRNAQQSRIYTAGPGLGAVWAPEIHYIRGEFYIYVAMETDGLNENHSMYVLKANNANDPMGQWSTAHRMYIPAEDYWAIDGTVLEYGNGKLYFIWSGWPQINSGFPQYLYIAEMCDPMTVCGRRVLIKRVDFPWERIGADLIEGPQILHNAGRVFLVYSASGSWTPDYILGFMGIDNLADPLNYDNWWRHDRPVFWRHDEENVYGVGHASLTTSPDKREPWIVYHAMSNPNAGWEGRTARAQKFGWNPDNSPDFGRPRGFHISLPVPSGTQTVHSNCTIN